MLDIVDVKGAVKSGEVKVYVKDNLIYLTYCNTEETVIIGEIGSCYKGMTNREVVKSVFGFEPDSNSCIIPRTWCNGNPRECEECRYGKWWDLEYRREEL